MTNKTVYLVYEDNGVEGFNFRYIFSDEYLALKYVQHHTGSGWLEVKPMTVNETFNKFYVLDFNIRCVSRWKDREWKIILGTRPTTSLEFCTSSKEVIDDDFITLKKVRENSIISEEERMITQKFEQEINKNNFSKDTIIKKARILLDTNFK